MKIYLFFCFLISTLSFAGPVTPFGTSAFTIQGHTYPNVPPIQLVCVTSSNTRCTFRKPSGSSGYTPSGSNKFYLQAASCRSTAASLQSVTLFYTTNDMGIDSATAASGPVYFGANSELAQLYASSNSSSSYNQYDANGNFAVPNADFLGMTSSGSVMYCDAWGYEGP